MIKSIKKLVVIFIIAMLIPVICVSAEGDYNILIDENNSFLLTDSANNPVVDDSIAKYENDTLILGEGNYFNQIKLKHDINITSNNKDVYIKELTTKEGNIFLPVSINVNELKVLENDSYKFKVIVGGNLLVNNSKLFSMEGYNIKGFLKVLDSAMKAKEYRASLADENGYGITIKNSEIEVSGVVSPYNSSSNTGLYIASSKVKANSLYSYGSAYINDSEVSVQRLTFQGKSDLNLLIKNTLLTTTKFDCVSNAILNIEDSSIYSESIYHNSSFNDMSKAGLRIYNSKVNTTSNILYTKELLIENSDVVTAYFTYTSLGNIAEHHELFKNSQIRTIDETVTNKFMDMIIENSNVDFCNKVEVTSLSVDNSIVKVYNKYSNIALFVKDNLRIKQSNIIVDSSSMNLIAVIVKNNVILDDNVLPIDNNKVQLKVIEMSKEQMVQLSPVQAQSLLDGDVVKIFTYQDNSYSNYVQLATKVKIVFKVRNGKWLDGTDDDIVLEHLYGESIEIENLPETLKKLLDSKMGTWSKDLRKLDLTKDIDIEFKYDIVNPETHILFIVQIIFLLILFISIFIVNKRSRIKKFR